MNISSIPFTTQTEFVSYPSGFQLCKVGTIIHYEKDASFPIFGFSLNTNPEIAKRIALSELYERCLAFSCMQRKNIDKDGTMSAYHYVNQNSESRLSIEHILLDSNSLTLDASGLSFHTTHELACQHSILELIERHLLVKLWFSNSFSLIQMRDSLEISPDYFLTRYSGIGIFGSLFSITIIESIHEKNSESDIWLFGSAFALRTEDAMRKSDQEAYMLLDNLESSRELFFSTHDSHSRIQSLKGSLSQKRRAYFSSKIIKQSDITKTYTETPVGANIINVLNWLNIDPFEVLMVDLYGSLDGYGVRAFCNSLLRVRESRRLTCNKKNIPLDPFC